MDADGLHCRPGFNPLLVCCSIIPNARGYSFVPKPVVSTEGKTGRIQPIQLLQGADFVLLYRIVTHSHRFTENTAVA